MIKTAGYLSCKQPWIKNCKNRKKVILLSITLTFKPGTISSMQGIVRQGMTDVSSISIWIGMSI